MVFSWSKGTLVSKQWHILALALNIEKWLWFQGVKCGGDRKLITLDFLWS